MSNRVRITLTSFLAYAVMAGMLSQIGIMISPIAEHYARETTEVASQFSWLTVGILLGSLTSLGIFDFVRIKTLQIVVFAGVVLAVSGFTFIDAYPINSLLMGAIGVGCGIVLPAAAIVISRTYQSHHRATMLVITDASFSLSGTICTALAVLYFSSNLHWSMGYSTVAIIAFVALCLTLGSDYPEIGPSEKISPVLEIRNWSPSVFVCMASLFLYLVGQNFILIWIPTYAQTLPGITAEAAGGLVSNYWAGMFMGQLMAAAILLRISPSKLAMVASVLATIATVPLWLLDDIDLLGYLTFTWGVVTLGLLKLILSWATEMVHIPGPRLISMLLMAATMGTAISPALSSALVNATNVQAPLLVGSVCYFLVITLVAFAKIKT